MTSHTEHDASADTATEVAAFRAPLFRVIMVNDDYTPMEFVVEVLRQLFAMPANQAEEVTLQIHQAGRGICGVFTREIAEAKVDSVTTAAERNEYPLLCIMEPEA